MPARLSICGLCERFTSLPFHGLCRGCGGKGIKSTYFGIGECLECKEIKYFHAKDRCRTCYDRLQYREDPVKFKKRKKALYYKHHEKQKLRGRDGYSLEKSRKDYELRRNHYREFMSKYKKECSVCGYDRCQRALEFHHINPEDKGFSLSMNTWQRFSLEKASHIFIEEIRKCVILCSNCHREIESNIISV